MLTKLWTDQEIAARIYSQANVLFADSIARGQKDRLYSILFDVMHKLTAMKYHLEAYRWIEDKMYAEHVEMFRQDPNTNSECFPLIFAFESFAFQLKSCLDMAVKMFTVVPLKNQVATHTYGDKGGEVIKGLRANQKTLRKLIERGTPCQGDKGIARIEALVKLMEGARDSWLQEAVEVRDDVSHYKAAKQFLFTPVRMIDGTIDAARPKFERLSATIDPMPFMEGLYRACLEFCQDFMSGVLQLMAPLSFDLAPADPMRAVPVAGAENAKYIKWEWRSVEHGIVTGFYDTEP